MKYLKRLAQIINGESEVDFAPKSGTFYLYIAGFHVLLLILFCHLDIWLMVGVNVLSVAVYLLGSTRRFRHDYFTLTIILCTEVMAHMLLCVISVGWDSAFYLNIVALVPAIYFLAYNIRRNQKRRISISIVIFITLVLFISMRSIDYFLEPLYKITPEAEFSLSIMNVFISFGTITLVMAVFATAVNKSESQLKTRNKKLTTLANTDPLTELYNRRGMQKRVERAIFDAEEENTTFCLVLGDIDNFKILNDTYGHECGDYILIRIATTIRELIRENDFTCRWGGEEILILFNNCKEERAAEIAEKIRHHIETNEVEYRGQKVFFTMTFGIQEYISGYRADELIRLADMKMYVGKRKGKNRVETKIENE